MSTPILLVEDDPDSQDLIRALCAAQGYEVDVAADGFLGLRLLSERRHAVVLIDYHLPEMDGYALARLMREIVGGQGRVRLVGITADRHGLASRRGADALFDAILVKPLEPDLLHATLERLASSSHDRGDDDVAAPAPRPDDAEIRAVDPAIGSRLSRPEEAGARSVARPEAAPTQAADLLWRRRGLTARPRAVLCPDIDPDAAAAAAQAFTLAPAESAESADLILVAAEAGLDGLRALRGDGPGRFLPAFDVTGRLGGICDAGFRVNEAASWDELARTVRAFAERRAALHPEIREAADPATRLLAALFVSERALALGACADPSAPLAETGLSRTALMAAALGLTEKSLAVCEAAADGVAVRLTEVGRAAARHGRGSAHAASRPESGPRSSGWRAPIVVQSRGALACAAPAQEIHEAAPAEPLPVRDDACVEKLRRAIGEAEVARLTANLLARLPAAFPADATPAALAEEAHALVAATGSLGFTRLSAACRRLQTHAVAGADPSEAVRAARLAVREALGGA